MDRLYTWAKHGIAEDPVRHVNPTIKEDGAQQRLKTVRHRVPAKYNREFNIHKFRIRIGFNQVCGSGSGFGIQSQEGKNDPQE